MFTDSKGLYPNFKQFFFQPSKSMGLNYISIWNTKINKDCYRTDNSCTEVQSVFLKEKKKKERKKRKNNSPNSACTPTHSPALTLAMHHCNPTVPFNRDVLVKRYQAGPQPSEQRGAVCFLEMQKLSDALQKPMPFFWWCCGCSFCFGFLTNFFFF